jgi:hypothetical protein
MIKDWGPLYSKIWQSLGFKDLTETFGEVSNQPFSDQDITALGGGLRELEKMNSDFLDMSVARAEVLIGKELGITKSLRSFEPVGERARAPKRKTPGFVKAA